MRINCTKLTNSSSIFPQLSFASWHFCITNLLAPFSNSILIIYLYSLMLLLLSMVLLIQKRNMTDSNITDICYMAENQNGVCQACVSLIHSKIIIFKKQFHNHLWRYFVIYWYSISLVTPRTEWKTTEVFGYTNLSKYSNVLLFKLNFPRLYSYS
jgi:hypothetical protein